MYIIYNSDGSIEKKSITEYIQQGNSYANVLFVTVKNADLGDYTASAIVTLPNGQNVGAIVEEAEEPVEIDGVEYDGYYITLDETCTLMAGAIRISLSLTIEEARMVTYPIYLNVNATPYDADAPVMISYNQYLELLASIAEVTTPNNPTITLQKNGVIVGYFSLNQASNKTINYVLSKSDVGLGNVDNTSDATKKSDFTGSIAENDTGFVTGGALYTYLNDYHTYKASTLSLKTSGSTAITFENIQGTLIFNNYAFSNSSIRYLTNNTCDLGSSEYKFKDLYLAGDSYANEYYIGGGTSSSLGREYGNTYIKTFNNDVTTKYYFATNYFSPDNTNAQDLGHESYKWKNLYLQGNANIGGKINNLTLPSGTHTLATKDDLVRTILDVSDTSVSALKNYVNENGGSFNFVYLVNSAGQETDISEAIKNGDYDNITIGNSIFSSTNLLVGTETSPNSTKYFVIRIPFTRKRYLVTGMNLHVLVTGTLYVADSVSPAKPSRFHYGTSWWSMGS